MPKQVLGWYTTETQESWFLWDLHIFAYVSSGTVWSIFIQSHMQWIHYWCLFQRTICSVTSHRENRNHERFRFPFEGSASMFFFQVNDLFFSSFSGSGEGFGSIWQLRLDRDMWKSIERQLQNWMFDVINAYWCILHTICLFPGSTIFHRPIMSHGLLVASCDLIEDFSLEAIKQYLSKHLLTTMVRVSCWF